MMQFTYIFFILLLSATAFPVSRLYCNRITQRQASAREEAGFDFNGFSDRLRNAYEEWCQVYDNQVDSSRMEVFSHHFMAAENYSRRTGVPVKLNEYAGLTDLEIQQQKENRREKSLKNSLGAEFLDFKYDPPYNAATQGVMYSSDLRGSQVPPGVPHLESLRPSANDPIARSTNAYLESMTTDSILPSVSNIAHVNEKWIEERTIKPVSNVGESNSKFEATIDIEDEISAEAVEDPEVLDESINNFSRSTELFCQEMSATPMAVEAARRAKVDLSTFTGTGKSGRITLGDVEAARKILSGESFHRKSNSSTVTDDSRDDSLEVFATLLVPTEEVENYGKVIDLSGVSIESADPVEATEPKTKMPHSKGETPLIFATSMALQTARKENIDLSTIQGTGKLGRITLDDVEAAMGSSPHSPVPAESCVAPDHTFAHAISPSDIMASTPTRFTNGQSNTRNDLTCSIPSAEEHHQQQTAATSNNDLPDWVVGNAPPLAPPEIVNKKKLPEITRDYDPEPPSFIDGMEDPVLGAQYAVEETAGPTREDDFSPEGMVDDVEIPLPELTYWMSEAKVVAWVKKIGDPVWAGETILIVECDTKISKETLEFAETQDIKSPRDGFLAAKYATIGELASVGSVLGLLSSSIDVAAVEADLLEFGASKVEENFLEAPHASSVTEFQRPIEVTAAHQEKASMINEDITLVMEHEERRRELSPTSEIRTKKRSKSTKVTSAWKSTSLIQWEPNRLKMDGLNHAMIPFLQKKIDELEKRALFRLPGTKKHISTSKARFIVWEDGPRKKTKSQQANHQTASEAFPIESLKRARFKVNPSVSWQLEQFQLPSLPEKRKNSFSSIHYLKDFDTWLAPLQSPSVEERKRTADMLAWGSFQGVSWEHDDRRRRAVGVAEVTLPDQKPPEKGVFATPMARATARKAKMDLSTIPGTGEHGRITLDDVKVALYPIIKQKGDSITMVTKESTPPLQSSGSPEISFATPMARVTARKENLELSMVKGTGVAGRITLDDVKNAVTKLNAKGNGKNQQESRTKGKHCK